MSTGAAVMVTIVRSVTAVYIASWPVNIRTYVTEHVATLVELVATTVGGMITGPAVAEVSSMPCPR